jgi:hypothetical protein
MGTDGSGSGSWFVGIACFTSHLLVSSAMRFLVRVVRTVVCMRCTLYIHGSRGKSVATHEQVEPVTAGTRVSVCGRSGHRGSAAARRSGSGLRVCGRHLTERLRALGMHNLRPPRCDVRCAK